MILFVDDEYRTMESYVEEIRLSNYDIKFIPNIDKALIFWNNYQKDISLLILDIMMPSGKLLNSFYAQNGLRTGIVFYKQIRKDNSKIPIIFFTNILKNSDNLISEILDNDSQTLFMQKEDYLPFELVEEISIILSSSI